MANEVWIGAVAVTALEGCLVLPPGEHSWVDVMVGAEPGRDFPGLVRQALVQYHLQVDGFGLVEQTRDRRIPLERTAQRLERELAKRSGVRLMTFRPILA